MPRLAESQPVRLFLAIAGVDLAADFCLVCPEWHTFRLVRLLERNLCVEEKEPTTDARSEMSHLKHRPVWPLRIG
ncbi:MAG: hypothetical protein KC643_07525 [Nitrospira sp.]|nr:hypothetical protein [Nitrospira sp.]